MDGPAGWRERWIQAHSVPKLPVQRQRSSNGSRRAGSPGRSRAPPSLGGGSTRIARSQVAVTVMLWMLGGPGELQHTT